MVDAVVVDPILEADLAVRQLGDGGAGHALGVVYQLVEHFQHRLAAMPGDQVEELGFGNVTGGELGAQVAEI